MKYFIFSFLFDPRESPFVCWFSKPKMAPVVQAAAPASSTTTVNNVTPAPPPPPAPARAAQFVRDAERKQTPRTGRRATMITQGQSDMAERRRSMLGTPYTPTS